MPPQPCAPAVQSFKWAGPPPRLWVEYGPEQRQAPSGVASTLDFPYIPSKSIDILVGLIWSRPLPRAPQTVMGPACGRSRVARRPAVRLAGA